jgi:hypothetical protein
MTLTDAGALVALLDADDPYHPACVAAAQRLPAGPLLTIWVCFTEAMYLLGIVGGYRYQAALWNLRTTGRLVVHDLTPAEADRMAALVAAALPIVVVNPRQGRDVAKATGQLAKTDARDARAVAHFAEAVWPVPRPYRRHRPKSDAPSWHGGGN